MKNVLITGANRGIGFETAKRFLDEGYHVILGIRDEQKGIETVKRLQNKNVTLLPLDVSSRESVLSGLKTFKESFDSLDVLINNAAINYDTWHNALNCDMNEIRETINVNLLGQWEMVHAFYSLMTSDEASIINVSSGAGALDSITGGTPGYSVSKAALNVLTINLSHSLPNNIKINAICPGWVRIDMGGANATGSPVDSANDIYALSQRRDLNGKFVRDGKVIAF